MFFFFFFKQKTAYEMRISDWSSDVCSSDLAVLLLGGASFMALMVLAHMGFSLEALFARAVEVKTQAALADGATTAEAAERGRSIMAPGNFIKDPVSAISFGLALMLGTDRKSTRLNSSH